MFGNLFGKKPELPEPRHSKLPNPLKLRLGGAVELDTVLVKVLGTAGLVLELPAPGTILSVASQGEVDLGQSVHLHRFYFNSDYWLQIKRSGSLLSDPEAGVDEIHFFGFGDVVQVSSQYQFEEFSGRFGLPTYAYGGLEWFRVWGGGPGPAAASEYQERVYPADDASYGTKHQDQLYRRQTELGKEELLLVSIETDDAEEVSIVHSVGICLDASELNIT